MDASLSRRNFLSTSTIGMGAAAVGAAITSSTVTNHSVQAAESKDAPPKFRYCLNTSTIRGQKLSLVEELELASKAGYDGVEPWIREIDDYVKGGGKLSDLKKRIADLGLKVESAIGFANWIVDDPQKRAAGLESAKRDMDLVAAIGGTRIAAPPVGATNQENFNLFHAAERYAKLLEVGDQTGVTPQLEVWGFSKTLSRLGESVFVMIESGHPKACLLPDIYHIYKGGSSFTGLKLLSGEAIHVFHVNDYPAEPTREKIGDADRVYPGDGVAPASEILQSLYANGFQGVLSLELFNKEYWKQDADVVVKTGLEKMKKMVAKAFPS